jgi:MFS family permease
VSGGAAALEPDPSQPNAPSELYTPAFLRAWLLHFTGAMSLAFFMLFPLFVKAVGGTELTIGLVLGVATAASVATRPVIGVVLDRIGRRRVLIWAGVWNVLSWVPFQFVTSPGFALYFWTVVHDLAWGALFTAYFTYAADLIPSGRRAEGVAIFGVAGMLANGLAPIVGERVIDAVGFHGYFGVAMVFGIASLAFSMGVPLSSGPTHVAEPPSLADVLPLARLASLRAVLLATIVLGIAINAAYMFIAPFTRELGIERTGPFFAAYSTTSIVIRLFGRRTLDALGPHGIAGPGFVAFAAGLAGLMMLPHAVGGWTTLVLVVCGIGCGMGHGALFPVLNALAVSRAPAGKQGAVVGLHTAAIDFGAVAGLPLCGALAEWAGYPVMYGLVGLASVAGLVIMARDPVR